LKPFYNI